MTIDEPSRGDLGKRSASFLRARAEPAIDELKRRLTVQDFDPGSTAEDPALSRLARLAAALLQAPMALVSLISSDRQFIRAATGAVGFSETSREVSFCSHAIERDTLMVVPDTLADERFCTNPFVLGAPFIRFYAGWPLVTADAQRLGTVCVLDAKPRAGLSDIEQQWLREIADMVMDRLELRRLDKLRIAGQARFESIAEESPDAIICLDVKGDVTYWNASAGRLFGYPAAEILGKNAERIVPLAWRVRYAAELERLREGRPLELADRTMEIVSLRSDGTEFPAELSLSRWGEGENANVGVIIRDITERKRDEARLTQLASRDGLTGLSNRAHWRESMESALQLGQAAAILLIDLDNFKEVNDQWGHFAGDAVLKAFAQRLTTSFPAATSIARLGGDEFVVLLQCTDRSGALREAERLVADLERLPLLERAKELRASVGVALTPEDGVTVEGLLGAADLALYRAKAAGKGGCEMFTPTLRELASARRAFEKELKQAFEQQQFELFYQPLVCLEDLRVVGAEALLRWRHPSRGLLSPAAFIDVLSAKPSAAAVGEWILRSASAQAAIWQCAAPSFRISVNLFASQLKSRRLLQVATEAITEAGLTPRTLELEIVENIFLNGDADTFELLRDLRAADVGLAFDDYGTGFASLSLLKRYPVNRLKIDRSFVQHAPDDASDAAIARTVQYLGSSFGMEVLAEGVETEEQLAFLRQIGCKEAQGYLFGRPVPAEEFAYRFLPMAHSCDDPSP